MQKLLISTLGALILLTNGCAGRVPMPGIVHKIDVQQGNVVNQEMVNQLRPGMEKRQVRFIMGTPLVKDAFHEDRWDYVYRYKKGGADDEEVEKRRVSLIFENDRLVSVQGDLRPLPQDAAGAKEKETIVEVPPQERDESIVKKVVDTFTFGDDE